MASYRCDPDRMRLGTTGDEQRNADGHRPFSAPITPTSTPARFSAVRYMFEAPGLPSPGRRIVGAHKAGDELRGREGADDDSRR